MSTNMQKLVDEFAYHRKAQNHCVFVENDAVKGNQHARAASKAFKALCALGDEGREALAQLFTHEDRGVRSSAACHLLRYKHGEARKVLEEIGKGEGWIAFLSRQCLERWKEGRWALDPEPTADPQSKPEGGEANE